MRPARVFRWIIRIFILILTASMSLVSILGGMSAINILGDSNNIQVPYGSVTFSRPQPLNISSWSLTVPFLINNTGYFDLTNFEIEISIEMYYNTSIHEEIYSGSQNYGTIAYSEILVNTYLIDSFTKSYPITGPLSFGCDITASGSYSLNLISFEIHIINMTL